MTFTRRLRKQRYRMWKADPHCYWCGVITIPPSWFNTMPLTLRQKRRGLMATIDHLRPRHHPGRLEPAHGEIRRVLSCMKCNNERDRIEHEMMPREKVWEMSKSRPLNFKPLDELKRIESILANKQPKRKADRERIYRSLVAVRDAIRSKSEQPLFDEQVA